MSVAIEIKAEGNAVEALARAASQIGDLSPLFSILGQELVDSTQARFEAGHGPDDNPWPESVRALLTAGKTLRDTGALVRSITHEADGQGVRIGTNAIYAAIHQFGGTIKATTPKGLVFRPAGGAGYVRVQSVNIPARPYLGLSQADEQEVVALTEDYLAGAFDAE